MARDQSFDELRRQRELEDQQEQEERAKARPGDVKAMAGNGSVEKLVELIGRAEPLIEQVNSLYNQYIAGVERRPPLERRKQLDQLMLTLQAMSKPTPSYQFRFNSLNASYLTQKERWERLIKDLESGKLKRPQGKGR